MTFQPFSKNFSDILGYHVSWEAQYLVILDGVSVAPRNVNDVYAVFKTILCFWSLTFHSKRNIW